MEPIKPRTLRCAIYTRKSSEEGLEQDFNSLHAQREACESFIRSQQGEGWRLIKTHYDDGGLSGGTMERPALQRLLEDIRQKLVDVVVVYKVDRLTRSLSDFAKMVEVFDAGSVSFVAVTQQFNTTTSMGRLTLNVLLSFAQFEREVTGERIRDKIAASKRKGMWMGGLVPLGYEVRDRQLVINPSEAETVRNIFQRYGELGSVRLLKHELDRGGIRSKLRVAKNGVRSGGQSFSRGALYTLLGNPIYVGEVRHKGTRHPGQHQPIVERTVWEKTDQLLHAHAARARGKTSKSMSSPLAGKLFDESGEGLTPSHAVKGKRRYRYYVSRCLIKGTANQSAAGWRIPAAEIERSVAAAASMILEDHTAIVADLEQSDSDASQIKSILEEAGAWSRRLRSEAEAGNALGLLVDRVELRQDGIRLSIKLPIGSSEKLVGRGPAHLALTRLIPMPMRRRGIEMKFVIDGDPGAAPRTDPALLKLIARAHCWFNDLLSGRAASMVEIGKREKVGKRYVSRIVRLAFLAPEIVEQIVNGCQPPELTAESLLKDHTQLPLSWESQHKMLEFPFPA
jgi:site-specific DNA recombinase